jgi:cadmium resistance protein CadD (predicted permease)
LCSDAEFVPTSTTTRAALNPLKKVAKSWVILLVYAVFLLLWCWVGKWLGNHALVLRSVDRYGHFIVPLVFVGLGIYILAG